MEGRDLVRSAALADYERNPRFAQEKVKAPAHEETLYTYSKPKQSEDYAWGMGIERLAMLLFGNIKDIRSFTENDLRFLDSIA